MSEQRTYVGYSDDVEVVKADEEQVINSIIAAMQGESESPYQAVGRLVLPA